MLPYCLTIATVGILRHQIAKILLFFMFSGRFFRLSLLQPLAVRSNWARSTKSRVLSNCTFDSISALNLKMSLD